MDLGDHRRTLISPQGDDQATSGSTRKSSTQASVWESGVYDDIDRSQGGHAPTQYSGFQEQFIIEPPPKQAPRGLWDKITRFESETWFVEIVNMCLSIVATVVAVIYLERYDGRTLPEWPKGITLNTLLSVCITVMGATLSIPISSGLGQLMWIRATKAQVSLSKMDMLDKASRGVWGSLLVIFGWAGGPLGALGGLTFILALLAAPLSQQAIHVTAFPSLSTTVQASIAKCKGGQGMAPRNVLFVDGTGKIDGSRIDVRNQLPSVMQGAYFNAIYANFDSSSFSEGFASCQTGNCTWEAFATLALCNQCKNVTSSLVTSNFSNGPSQTFTQYTLPGGVNLNPRIVYNISDSKPSERIHHSYVTAMLFAAAKYVSNGDEKGTTRPEAIECALAYCVQVIQPEVKEGKLTETVLETYQFDDSTITERVRAHTIRPPANNPNFTEPISVDLVDADWVGGAATFQGAVGINVNTKAETWVLWEKPLDQLETTFNNIAAAMSRGLRITCNGTEKVSGSAWSPITIVRIRWYWLAVPFLVEALGLIFFIAIVALNYRSGARLWKTSFLATCFHSSKMEYTRGRPQLTRLDSVYEMEREANKLRFNMGGPGISYSESRLI